MKNIAASKRSLQVAALRSEGLDAWTTRSTRLTQSTTLILMGFAAIGASVYFRAQPLTYAGLVVVLASSVLFADSLRHRFRAERIDVEMRRLDPGARLLTSWPEEYVRDIRAALDRRAKAGRSR